MTSRRRRIALVAALMVAVGALVVWDLLAASPTPVPVAPGRAVGAPKPAPVIGRNAEDPEPPPDSLRRYRLSEQELLGLPAALELQPLSKRFGAGQGPAGIQYFQSAAGLSGTFLLKGDALQARPLRFLARGEWTFLRDRRFRQLDADGNRLLLGDGKAQIFNAAGRQIGAHEEPGLGLLYKALLRATM